MMLSSSCVLFLVRVGQSFEILVKLFVCYMFWVRLVIMLLR